MTAPEVSRASAHWQLNADDTSTWTLTTGWPTMPMSLNVAKHWAAKARAVKQVRDDITKLAKFARIPKQDHIIVEMVWTVPDRRIRDADNPTLTFKAVCDALGPPFRTKKGVSAGAEIVPGDDPRYMTKLMPRIEYRKGKAGVRVEITAARTKGVRIEIEEV